MALSLLRSPWPRKSWHLEDKNRVFCIPCWRLISFFSGSKRDETEKRFSCEKGKTTSSTQHSRNPRMSRAKRPRTDKSRPFHHRHHHHRPELRHQIGSERTEDGASRVSQKFNPAKFGLLPCLPDRWLLTKQQVSNN